MMIYKVNFTSNNFENIRKDFQNSNTKAQQTQPINISSNQNKKQNPKWPFIVGGACAVSFGALAVTSLIKKQKLPDTILDIKNAISNVVSPKYTPELVDTSWNYSWAKDTVNESHKGNFLRDFIEPLKNGDPFMNGFMTVGPESQAKKDFFNWAIGELEKAGVKVYDTTDPATGKTTVLRTELTFDEAGIDKFSRMEEFAQNKDYRLVVIRNLDDLGLDEDGDKLGDTLLKGDTAKSAKRYGIMLAYNAEDDSGYEIATRIERIDRKCCIRPYEDESLDIWKQYLDLVQYRVAPHWAQKGIEEAQEIFSKKSPEIFEEMKPYLHYHPPYEIPKVNGAIDSNLKHWDEYFRVTKENIDPRRAVSEYREIIDKLVHDVSYKKISHKTYENVLNKINAFAPEEYKEGLMHYAAEELRTIRI